MWELLFNVVCSSKQAKVGPVCKFIRSLKEANAPNQHHDLKNNKKNGPQNHHTHKHLPDAYRSATIDYTYIRRYIHTYIHTYINTYIHTYIHTHIHIYIHAYIHTHILTCIHTYINTYMHTYTHTMITTMVLPRKIDGRSVVRLGLKWPRYNAREDWLPRSSWTRKWWPQVAMSLTRRLQRITNT